MKAPFFLTVISAISLIANTMASVPGQKNTESEKSDIDIHKVASELSVKFALEDYLNELDLRPFIEKGNFSVEDIHLQTPYDLRKPENMSVWKAIIKAPHSDYQLLFTTSTQQYETDLAQSWTNTSIDWICAFSPVGNFSLQYDPLRCLIHSDEINKQYPKEREEYGKGKSTVLVEILDSTDNKVMIKWIFVPTSKGFFGRKTPKEVLITCDNLQTGEPTVVVTDFKQEDMLKTKELRRQKTVFEDDQALIAEIVKVKKSLEKTPGATSNYQKKLEPIVNRAYRRLSQLKLGMGSDIGLLEGASIANILRQAGIFEREKILSSKEIWDHAVDFTSKILEAEAKAHQEFVTYIEELSDVDEQIRSRVLRYCNVKGNDLVNQYSRHNKFLEKIVELHDHLYNTYGAFKADQNLHIVFSNKEDQTKFDELCTYLETWIAKNKPLKMKWAAQELAAPENLEHAPLTFGKV